MIKSYQDVFARPIPFEARVTPCNMQHTSCPVPLSLMSADLLSRTRILPHRILFFFLYGLTPLLAHNYHRACPQKVRRCCRRRFRPPLSVPFNLFCPSVSLSVIPSVALFPLLALSRSPRLLNRRYVLCVPTPTSLSHLRPSLSFSVSFPLILAFVRWPLEKL